MASVGRKPDACVTATYRAAEDGWHRIIVTTCNQGALGPYTLSVQ
jgi:hypothetical protein